MPIREPLVADLLERLPAAVAYLSGPEHRFEFANDACRRLLGGRDLIGRPAREAVPEVAPQGYFETLDRVIATGRRAAGREAEVWVRGDGETPEQRYVDFAFEPVSGADGRVAGVLVHATDVTQHVHDERANRLLTAERDEAEDRYRTLFATMLHGVVYQDADGAIIMVNPAAGEILGAEPETLVGLRSDDPSWAAVREDGSPFPGSEHPAMTALRTGEVVRDVLMGVTHGRTGERRWLLVTAIPDDVAATGRPQRVYTMFTDVTAQRRSAAALRERESLIQSARVAQAEAVTAQERLGFLLRAGALAAATHDEAQLLEHATRLVVPAMADFAAVFLPTPEGDLRLAEGGQLGGPGSFVHAILMTHPLPAGSESLLQGTYRDGGSRLVRDLGTRDWSHLDPAFGDVVHRLQLDSMVSVVLSSGADRLGVLVLGRTARRAEFADSDVPVIEELGRRLAVGLQHAETFAREHGVAEALQQSVLPEVLPTVPGLDLAVRYLPATEGVGVGGDWYDAFPLGDGAFGLVIGDVVGHDLASASAMSQLRNALRAFAVDVQDPAAVLGRTNAALSRLLPGALATVFYGVLDPGTGELAFANAGHPAPLVARAEGPTYLTEPTGLMLGVDEHATFTTGRVRLGSDCVLLLYSDGLVEDRKRSIDVGFAELAAVFAAHRPTTAEAVCATAEEALMVTPSRADDVCLLAAVCTRATRP